MSISLRPSDNPIAVHEISKEKGKVITDPKHRRRSQTKREKLAEEVMEKLADPEDSSWLIKTLQEYYPRHTIDQLKVVLQAIENYPKYIDDALKEMKKLRLTSANDLRDIAISLEIDDKKDSPHEEIINEKYKEMVAPERNQDVYLYVLQGGK